MKEKANKEAERLLNQYCMIIYGLPINEAVTCQEVIQCAINDVTNTIDVLHRTIKSFDTSGANYQVINDEIKLHQQVKTILTDKLK